VITDADKQMYTINLMHCVILIYCLGLLEKTL